MRLRWHANARAEADAAVAFYNEKHPRLAQRFLDDLEVALHRIRRLPNAYHVVEGDLRKCRVPHFPYGVIYRTRAGMIEIIAVMHLRRSPGYWRHRTVNA
jgi:plasmid stabilization system protein ParE